MIASRKGRGSHDPTEVGTGSNAGPHFAFGGGDAGWSAKEPENGAGYRIRTRGPLITNQVLYQLS